MGWVDCRDQCVCGGGLFEVVQVPWFITHWLGEFSLPNQATMICDTEAPLIILTFLHFSLFSFSYLLFSTSLLSPSLPHYLLFSTPLPLLPSPPLSPALFPLPFSLSALPPSLPPTSALSPLLRYYDQLGAFENKLPISESQVFPY